MQITNDIIFEYLSEGVVVLDMSGKIVSCNPAACDITGYREGDLMGKPFHALGNGEGDLFQYQYERDQALQHKKLVVESWKVHQNGTRFWCETSYAPIFTQEEHTGFCVVLRDISERKQIQIELLESEERYRLMVEAVKDYSIFMLDPQGHIITWSDGGGLIQGYAESEVLGKHFSIFYTATDLIDKKPDRELEIARQTGAYREEGWRVKKGGSLFWASVVLTALFNNQNKLIGYSKVTMDLTRRLQNEESLRQSEARYRSLVEQVGDYGIFMLDTKGRICSWNEGAKRIKGYTAQEVIGKYFSIFYPEEDILSGKPARELRIARATGKYEEEGWRLRKDGSRFWANIVITAVYDTERLLTGFSKVTRDLTERKLAEQGLQERSNEYRQLVQELMTTNNALSAVNHELEEFTAIVSHDLKEPVRSVKSYLYLIEQQIAQQKYEAIGSSVLKSIKGTQRMQDLIDNLLQYSQVSKTDLKREKLDLDDVVAEALLNLDDAIRKSGAQISKDMTTQGLFGDRVQLAQMFQNLLANALKFTDGKTPEVSIRSWPESDVLRIVVTDNGIGIAEQHLEKVFGVFKKLHFASKYPGTGMGLAICKKVVERHNGKIWAESSPGQGTSFHIMIPTNEPTKI
ncbi:PAS domain S-box protein [Dyadobacter chenwenxiniae]|uniref:histidine kinase n=1 Tax=Dyadobacter chenwenxiniae TaxID=2906456 RepID=A0A9X1PQD2_9BACT|nr:PAS domain-containing sensor histidine kinase [Dyadobacter chenwenxiniae]MCF0063753.1 PAS domain S-box protein [Dyadobacter chenwenxiniae]UON83429.1 PAS domain S-box protein [Dyadobacter chenwenxiniae]